MKILKAIFGNALVLAMAVTILAGTVLVAYADRKPGPEDEVRGLSPRAGEGTPTAPAAARRIPRGSFIDAML
jgi:hypothetical protein